MTISKGSDWGAPGPLPDGSPVATDNPSLRALVVAQRRGGAVVPIGLSGGDLHRTVGSPDPGRLSSNAARHYPIDVVEVTLDDAEPTWFVAHLVAGASPMWLRRTLVVMNAAFIGPANLGPRAHPGDGLVDVTDGRVPLGEIGALRRRVGSGSHVPHPGLATSRVAAIDVVFDRPVPVRLDDEAVGSACRIRCRVLPDAATVIS